MRVIRQDTESKLLEELKKFWEDQPAYRCLHLKLSTIEEDQNPWFDLMMTQLRVWLGDDEAQAYICADGDVFVITRPLMMKKMDELHNKIASILAPAPVNKDMLALYEIGVDWPKLRGLCDHKITILKEQAAAQTPKKPKKALPKLSKEEALSKIDPDWIKTLAERRKKRDTPEIMVVEDDPFSQKLVSNALKNKYTYSMIGDGVGALMGYVTKAPDVLFLDIGLPDTSGHEVLKRIFKMDPDAYVVMFSGNGDRENVLKAVELGAKGFVGKPFTQQKLIEYIKKSPFIRDKEKRSTDLS